MALRLTEAFTDNLRVHPLKDGTVKPENTDVDFLIIDAGALFYRNLKCAEFEASGWKMFTTGPPWIPDPTAKALRHRREIWLEN